MDRRSGLSCIEEELLIGYTIPLECHRVRDPKAAVTQQQHHSPYSLPVTGPILPRGTEQVTSPIDFLQLGGRERERGVRLNLRRIEGAGWVRGNPPRPMAKLEERPEAFKLLQ